MLRADVCNAVDELGQLLDHTGPVAPSERNAARIFNADHCFFVTNGTSTSNKMVWHHTVAPGDVVVVDRNCHKSHPARDHHDRRGAGVPAADAQPLRHHRPDPAERSSRPRRSARKIAANPLLAGVDADEGQAAHPDADAEHLRRRALQHRDHQARARRLHRHAALRRGLAAARRLPHASTASSTRWARSGRGRRTSWSSPRSARTSCWPASARPAQVLVQDAQTRKLDRHLFNEAYLMHTSTSPQYAIIASCDVAAAMMEAPGGTALVEESIAEALDFRRAMRKVDKEYGSDWWFKVWGPDKLAAEGIGTRRRLDAEGRRQVARLRRPGRRLQPARPDQEHDHHAGAGRVAASSPRPASRRPSSPSSWPSTASWSRRPGCTRSSSCSRSASPRAAGTRC